MAGTIEQQTTTNGASTRPEIEVLNPATGEVIGRVPDLGPVVVAELARRGRAAQPGWEALGFEGRGRILRRAQ
jgi:acyl-CoA reductase-like NAD-dependent aldehyde dehydrogenase